MPFAGSEKMIHGFISAPRLNSRPVSLRDRSVLKISKHALSSFIAILVTCMVSYRALFTHDPEHHQRPKTSGHTPLHQNPTDHTLPYTETNAFKTGGRESESSSVIRAQEEVLPLDTIQVRNEYTVHSQV